MKQHSSLLLGGLLALSVGLNIFLSNRVPSQNNQFKSADASDIDLPRKNEDLRNDQTSAADPVSPRTRELLRLRNEVGQLRKEAAEAASWRGKAAEAAQLRAQLAAATQAVARAESELSAAVKLSPEELQQVKEEARSVQCVNSLKQIGRAAWQWAKAHGNVFPPDFISMKDELRTPKILFCPADPAAISVSEWSQLNPSYISYRMNPNGVNDPAAPLATCLIHGHSLFIDGSVHRQ